MTYNQKYAYLSRQKGVESAKYQADTVAIIPHFQNVMSQLINDQEVLIMRKFCKVIFGKLCAACPSELLGNLFYMGLKIRGGLQLRWDLCPPSIPVPEPGVDPP